jgi:hypothetical protein
VTYRRLSLLLLMVVGSCPLGRSQASGNAGRVESVYRNFLGSWDGESEHVVGGQLVRETVELVVTEEPEKHRLRFDYHRNNGITPDKRRFLNLDPSNEVLTMQSKGSSKDRCAASGLKEFAQTGLGDFSAICHSKTDRLYDSMTGQLGINRITFHLGIDTLKYEWALSTDGKIYAVYSKFSFKRKPKHDIVSLLDAGGTLAGNSEDIPLLLNSGCIVAHPSVTAE